MVGPQMLLQGYPFMQFLVETDHLLMVLFAMLKTLVKTAHLLMVIYALVKTGNLCTDGPI